MILSSAEILGRRARSTSALPSIMSMGASCGSATKPPNGIEPNEYCTPSDRLLPKRLAEPDAEFFDVESAPARRQEMAKLVDNDQQIKEDDDLKEG